MSGSETGTLKHTGSAGLLSATYHFMMSRIMDELTHAGFEDLSKTQLHVLARFGEQEMTLEQLSQRVQIPLQVVANIAHMLATSGYITEVSESTVLGAVGYTVTPRGYEALDIVTRGQHAVEREWVEQLGEEAVQNVIDSLSNLFNATMGAAKNSSRNAL